MPASRNINTYLDVADQLKKARDMGGAEITFPAFGAACAWVARVYTYRKLLSDSILAGMAAAPTGFQPSTPWDDLIITHDKVHRSISVKVQFGMRLVGTMKPLPENQRIIGVAEPIALDPIPDDLEAAVLALVAKELK